MKRRVYQVAKEFRISSEALIGVLQKLGYDVKTHMNAIDDDVVASARAEFEKEKDVIKREFAKKLKKAARERAKAPAAGKGKGIEGAAKPKPTAAGATKPVEATKPARAKKPAEATKPAEVKKAAVARAKNPVEPTKSAEPSRRAAHQDAPEERVQRPETTCSIAMSPPTPATPSPSGRVR